MKQFKEQLAVLVRIIQTVTGLLGRINIEIASINERLNEIELRLDKVEYRKVPIADKSEIIPKGEDERLNQVEDRLNHLDGRADKPDKITDEAPVRPDVVKYNSDEVNKKLDFLIQEIVRMEGVTRYVDPEGNLRTMNS